MRRSNKRKKEDMTKSPVGEAYRILRTNIQFSSNEGSPKIILVTSSSSSEGKSTTAVNLAITIAQSGRRVLLVDADLRKPAIHTAFNLKNGKGLTNALVERWNLSKVTQSTHIENLWAVTSGPKPPNPSEILNSGKMKDLLELAGKEYDNIILDTPPVLPVTDAAVLASAVDGVVLVAAYGQATYDSVHLAREQLEKVGAKILGVVLNRVPASNHRGYYYYYYYDSRRKRKDSIRLLQGAEQEEPDGQKTGRRVK